MDETGKVLARRRLPEWVAGVGRLHELIGEQVDDPAQVAVGIDTDRGLWAMSLVAAGYQVHALNPLSVARTGCATPPPGPSPTPRTPRGPTWPTPACAS